MGLLQRQSFARGWLPDADKVNGPADGLLRMDNCTLDEQGVVALRPGSAVVQTLADADVHSLYTAILAGTRYRFAGAGNTVYANGSPLSGVGGAGDVAFGSYLGQVLFARGGTAKKYDGGFLRNWGVAMTGGAPTITPVTSDGKTFASFDSGESPGFVIGEDDGTGLTYAAGEDGTANGALILHPAAATNRATATKTFGAPVDFTAYDSGGVGTDNDLLELWVYVTEPTDLLSVTVMIDVNGSSAQPFQDYYIHGFVPGDNAPLGPTDTSVVPPSIASSGNTGAHHRNGAPVTGSAVPRSDFNASKPVANVGWSLLAVRRSDMTRNGSTSGKDWTTVKAVRVIIATSSPTPIQFDLLRMVANPLNGAYKWCYVYVFNSGTYLGLSAPSPLSPLTQIQAQGATVTIPADGSRDPQVNECWVFRFGGVMDGFYRTALLHGTSGTGSFAITDTLSDIDATVTAIPLQTDNGPAPSGILSIAGPYYDRVFALTATTLWVSRRINPDSFATGQAITIAGADETPYWIRKVLNGLYIGTSKDIYALTGTGAELPDGSIDFTKTPLSVDHPPVSDGATVDGSLLIYISDTGWRTFAGSTSASISGDTKLLYRGQTRHGVGPVNLTSGRFRAAVGHGQLICLTPEGAATTSSPVLYRNVAPASTQEAWAGSGHWYRHTYPNPIRSLYREPDGTVLAGDIAGNVSQLDTGATGDNGVAIFPVIWTKVDDNGQPYQRKDLWDFRARLDSGSTAGAIALHLDGSDVPAVSIGFNAPSDTIQPATLAALPACRQVQLRITGAAYAFRLFDFGVNYRDHPLLTYYMEPKPQPPSATRRRFTGLNVILDTVDGAAATVQAVLDNVVIGTFAVSTTGPAGRTLSLPAVVGRDLWPRIDKDVTGFELYEATPRIIEELPKVVQGLLPKTNSGYTGVKILSGVRFRACTMALTRRVTIYLDNVPLPQTFLVTTGLNDPDDVTLDFTAAQTARDIALFFDGDVELYEWSPIVSAQQPLGVTAWDSGPIDLGGRELVWLRRLDLKVRAATAMTFVAWLDGVPLATRTAQVVPGADTVVPVDFPRGTKGRQPRLVVTSAAPFFPYWIKVIERETGYGQEKTFKTVPVTLGGAAQ